MIWKMLDDSDSDLTVHYESQNQVSFVGDPYDAPHCSIQ
jgi:hypothetical protein